MGLVINERRARRDLHYLKPGTQPYIVDLAPQTAVQAYNID